MLNNIKKRNESGFTIIEVLIVLAIAGLILLVVFLAVPALQRNSRNTQRKSDISAIAGAINEYESNNGGSQLTTSTAPTAITNAKLGFYTSGSVFYASSGTVPGTATTSGTGNASTLTTNNVIVWIGYDCSGTSPAGTPLPKQGSARSVAVQYAVESSSSAIEECSAS